MVYGSGTVRGERDDSFWVRVVVTLRYVTLRYGPGRPPVTVSPPHELPGPQRMRMFR